MYQNAIDWWFRTEDPLAPLFLTAAEPIMTCVVMVLFFGIGVALVVAAVRRQIPAGKTSVSVAVLWAVALYAAYELPRTRDYPDQRAAELRAILQQEDLRITKRRNVNMGTSWYELEAAFPPKEVVLGREIEGVRRRPAMSMSLGQHMVREVEEVLRAEGVNLALRESR